MEKIINEIINDSSFIEGAAWHRRNFYANATIVKEGDLAKSLFFIESGRLRVSVDVELEEQQKVKPGLGDLGKGDLFGDTCLHDSGVRTATVVAITDGCLLEINGDRLAAYLDAHPLRGYVFYKQLFKILFKRLNNGNRKIQYLLAWGMKGRKKPPALQKS